MNPHCIVHRERPKVQEGASRPPQLGMNQTSPGHIRHCLYGSLGNTILMVRSNATERQLLFESVAMTPKLLRTEDAVVGVVALDRDTNLSGLLLNAHLAPDGVAGGSGALVVDEETATRMIGIDGAASEAVAR